MANNTKGTLKYRKVKRIPWNMETLRQDYGMTSFEDGINADHQAMDYRKQEQSLKKGDHITVRLARNGGFAAVIR